MFSLYSLSAFAACSGVGTGGGGGSGGPAGANGNSGNNGQIVTGGCANGGGGGGGGGGSGGGGGGATGAGGGVLLKTTSGTVSITGVIDARGGNSSTTNGGTVKIFNSSGCATTDTVSAGRIYNTGGNCPPSAPALYFPVNSTSGNSVYTTFKLQSSDKESDYIKYWIDVCSNNTCTSIVRSVCQYASGAGVPGTCTASQIGWAGQDSQAGTAYSGNPILTLSTIATHNYQPPLLSANTQYWWRGYAIDPGGSNTWSSASTINTFTTAPTETHIQGNVRIQGNTRL